MKIIRVPTTIILKKNQSKNSLGPWILASVCVITGVGVYCFRELMEKNVFKSYRERCEDTGEDLTHGSLKVINKNFVPKVPKVWPIVWPAEVCFKIQPVLLNTVGF